MKDAARPILSTTVSRRIDVSRPPMREQKKPSNKPSGRRQLEQHEASLVPFIRSKTEITIVFLDGQRLDYVVPIGFDRYTIAVEYDGFRETVFKSAIARIITPAEV